jgi:hypothetical protein
MLRLELVTAEMENNSQSARGVAKDWDERQNRDIRRVPLRQRAEQQRTSRQEGDCSRRRINNQTIFHPIVPSHKRSHQLTSKEELSDNSSSRSVDYLIRLQQT